MALHIIVLGLILLAAVASFGIAWNTGHKIFFVGAFLLLMFSGILIQSSGGLIIGSYASQVSDFGDVTLSDIVVPITDSGLYLVSQVGFFVGLVLLAWTGLTAAFSTKTTSPFDF